MKKPYKILWWLSMLIALPAFGANVKVMSFNIRFDNPKDTALNSWVARCMPCSLMFQSVRPDVIGMQEPRGDKQIADIKAMLPEYVAIETVVPENVNVNKAGRIMLFYRADKYVLKSKGQFWLNDNPEVPAPSFETTDKNNLRAALWMRLQDKATGKNFYLATTHFPYKRAAEDDTAREKCAALIVAKMKKIAGEKATVFVTGDMNASFEMGDIHRLSVRPFFEWMRSAREMARESENKSTFNGFKVPDHEQPKVLDHIFYRNAEPMKFVVHDEDCYGVPLISDHFPIVCDFEY